MQRAAAGLATVCVRLLAGVYGRQVVLLVGTGNNGGDALFAGARLAARGARVTAVLLDPARAHPAGLAALRRAGGRGAPPRAEGGGGGVGPGGPRLGGRLGLGGGGGAPAGAGGGGTGG